MGMCRERLGLPGRKTNKKVDLFALPDRCLRVGFSSVFQGSFRLCASLSSPLFERLVVITTNKTHSARPEDNTKSSSQPIFLYPGFCSHLRQKSLPNLLVGEGLESYSVRQHKETTKYKTLCLHTCMCAKDVLGSMFLFRGKVLSP